MILVQTTAGIFEHLVRQELDNILDSLCWNWRFLRPVSIKKIIESTTATNLYLKAIREFPVTLPLGAHNLFEKNECE